jgi:hypothetical protein
VAEHRIERPQRRLRTGGLEFAVQLHLQAPREEHVAGHTHHDGVGAHPFERGAARVCVHPDRSALDRLPEEEERAHREPFREAATVEVEVVGHRRPIEPGVKLPKRVSSSMRPRW